MPQLSVHFGRNGIILRMTTPDVPLRADARRNRDQILVAAREIFAERGAEVPMEEIARGPRSASARSTGASPTGRR